MSSTGLMGEELEERLLGQPGPGWEGLKCQAKGLGLNFSGTREPLMILEPVSDLIKMLYVSMLEGWAWGDIYVASHLPVPSLQFRVRASQECA